MLLALLAQDGIVRLPLEPGWFIKESGALRFDKVEETLAQRGWQVDSLQIHRSRFEKEQNLGHPPFCLNTMPLAICWPSIRVGLPAISSMMSSHGAFAILAATRWQQACLPLFAWELSGIRYAESTYKAMFRGMVVSPFFIYGGMILKRGYMRMKS